MEVRLAKELLHIQHWLEVAATRGLDSPAGVSWSDAAKNREKLAHHYSIINREVTWQTLSVSGRERRTARVLTR